MNMANKTAKRWIRLFVFLTVLLFGQALSPAKVSAASTVRLSELKAADYGGDGRGYTFTPGKEGGIRAVDGTVYKEKDVVVLDGSHSSWVVYNLNKKYYSFSGRIVTGDALTDSNCHTGSDKSIDFSIWGDGKQLFEEHGISREKSGINFSVNLKNVKKLEIKSGNQGSYSFGFFFIVKGTLTKDSLKLSEKTIKMDVGDSAYLGYTLTDGNGDEISAKATFKSNKTKVAKVSSKGKIVAVGPGVCTITVKAKGQQATCTVIVLPKKVSDIKAIAKNKTSLQLKWKKQSGVKGYQIFMYDTDLEEYVRMKTTSSNTALIKGLKKGTTYRFKIRSYIASGNKKYYGSYSKVFKAKTKK